jgi:hypothetical protein
MMMKKEGDLNPSTNHLIGHSESVCACFFFTFSFCFLVTKKASHVLYLNIYDWQWDERLELEQTENHQKKNLLVVVVAQPAVIRPSSTSIYLRNSLLRALLVFIIFPSKRCELAAKYGATILWGKDESDSFLSISYRMYSNALPRWADDGRYTITPWV